MAAADRRPHAHRVRRHWMCWGAAACSAHSSLRQAAASERHDRDVDTTNTSDAPARHTPWLQLIDDYTRTVYVDAGCARARQHAARTAHCDKQQRAADMTSTRRTPSVRRVRSARALGANGSGLFNRGDYRIRGERRRSLQANGARPGANGARSLPAWERNSSFAPKSKT
jgi:hypothetical protein